MPNATARTAPLVSVLAMLGLLSPGCGADVGAPDAAIDGAHAPEDAGHPADTGRPRDAWTIEDASRPRDADALACAPGTVETAPGVCVPCDAGEHCVGGSAPRVNCGAASWDDDGDPATACAPQSDCAPGESVVDDGSATVDRTCEPCAAGSFSALTNSAECRSWTLCTSGSAETRAPSDRADRECTPCGAAEWDDDADAGSACVPRTDCAAGERVVDDGSATSDRACEACAIGTFSESPNALDCAPWTDCGPGFVEATPGTAASDRRCDISTLWTRQFGETDNDYGTAVGVDGSGNVYVAGIITVGALPGQTSAGSYDAFVRKYDAAGTELWTRQFGSPERDYAYSLSVDPSGNVLVAGFTYGVLPGQTGLGRVDAYVRKYDSSGNVLWTRQFGSLLYEWDCFVSTDASGNVFVAGTTTGALPGHTAGPGFDVFVRKYDATGTELWTRQLGADRSPVAPYADDRAEAITVDASGNVIVVGSTDGVFPGQPYAGSDDVFVRMYDPSGNELWTREFGTRAADIPQAVGVDASGHVVVAGETAAALPGQAHAGARDAFVRIYDGSGTELWTDQFGSPSDDRADAVSVDGSGHVLVAGSAHGPLPGHTSGGSGDAFVRSYDLAGLVLWTRPFGTGGGADALGVHGTGNLLIAGNTSRTLPGQTSAGRIDAFVMMLPP